jgi:membrane associated rhomboid family serine protease
VLVVDVVTFLALLLILGVGFIAMAPESRERLRQMALASITQIRVEATRSRPDIEQFREALRARTRWTVVTPALIALNVMVFVLMLQDAGAVSDPETIVRRGGNFWLNTRNGEWWRLVTSMFVHAGFFQLLVNMAGVAQIGLTLERLVGRVIVIAVFLTAGIFANLVNLTTYPTATGIGASGAIFGLYGLLLASSIWSMRHPSSLTIPPRAMRRLVPAAAVFILYNLVNDGLGIAAEITGALVGLVCGAVLTKGVSDRKPAARRVAHVTAAAVVIAVVCVLPLRGITDVKPELERTVAAEDRTAGIYRKAADRFKNGQMNGDALALLIDRAIIPDLQITGARLKALVKVPEEHQLLVAKAEEYVRLRSESWRLRSEWLRKTGKAPSRGNEAAQYRANIRTIAKAEETERAALAVLEKIQLTP